MSEVLPKLWSDFDGTAVAIAKRSNPRNWSKYPLPGVKGYGEFLRGVATKGVEIAGVVSRRPDILVRRVATARSITKLGYGDFFPRRDQIVHTGSEEAKGRFVSEQSRAAVIGMLEDKPHKLGAILLGTLSEVTQNPELQHHPILLGVVRHKESQSHIAELAEAADRISSDDVTVTETGPITALGMNIEAQGFSLHVVQLEPFSVFSGERFGQKLVDLAV